MSHSTHGPAEYDDEPYDGGEILIESSTLNSAGGETILFYDPDDQNSEAYIHADVWVEVPPR